MTVQIQKDLPEEGSCSQADNSADQPTVKYIREIFSPGKLYYQEAD
jgi:hypothetical protein